MITKVLFNTAYILRRMQDKLMFLIIFYKGKLYCCMNMTVPILLSEIERSRGDINQLFKH